MVKATGRAHATALRCTDCRDSLCGLRPWLLAFCGPCFHQPSQCILSRSCLTTARCLRCSRCKQTDHDRKSSERPHTKQEELFGPCWAMEPEDHHHCQWLGNAIGFLNRKFFMLCLLYSSASCVLTPVGYWQTSFSCTATSQHSADALGSKGDLWAAFAHPDALFLVSPSYAPRQQDHHCILRGSKVRSKEEGHHR